jgi:hypothetical protein
VRNTVRVLRETGEPLPRCEAASRLGVKPWVAGYRLDKAEGPLAKALRHEWDSIQKVVTVKRGVTPALALRAARFAGIAMDELLAEQWLSSRVCPHCGHPPEDFADEETMVDG